MPLLYDRTENKDTIVIVFKYQVVFYLILLVFVISIPFTKNVESIMFGVLIVAFFVQIFGKVKPNKEIKQAMKIGEVQVSGNKFSFKNPITFTIKKNIV